MYQVLARKWRPQSFDMLVGQSHVSRTLTNAIEADRLAHAYIFSGLRGTGKTSAARILAKCLNCEQGPTPTPCNTCTPCTEITEGRAIDILEIDAASRTKVEQTRELLETLSYAPSRDRYKVLIIDEVHMLSKSSFNALLKTLEEPPPRVVFVLATTELHKILPTILSRCQVFEFRRVTPLELSKHLRRICDAEDIRISDPSLDRIARYGEGSIRDSLSILERVLAFCGTEIDDDDVLSALGAVRTEVLVRWLRSLAARDASAMLGVLDEVAGEGRDLVHLWSEMIGVLRDLQVARAAPDREELLTRTPSETTELIAAAEGLSREDLNRAFGILAGLEFGLKSSAQPRFLFESVLIRLASLGAVRPIEEFLAGLDDPGSLAGPAPPAGAAGGATRPVSPPGPGTPRTPGGSQARRASGPPPPGPAPENRGGDARQPGGADRPIAKISKTDPALRRRFEDAVRDAKPMLGGILGHAVAIRVDHEDLVIAFAPGDELWLRQIERDDYRDVLLGVGKALCGVAAVRITEENGAPSGGNGTRETAPDGGRPGSAPGRGATRKELMDTAQGDPGVRQLLREFGAQVVDIRPLAGEAVADGDDDRATEEDT